MRFFTYTREHWPRKPKQPHSFDPKPLRITVTLADGQNRTWAMGPGDGVGLGDVRVDVASETEIAVTLQEGG